MHCISDLEHVIEETKKEKDEALEQVLQLKHEIEQFHKAASERIEKMERVDKQLSILQKKVDSERAKTYLVITLVIHQFVYLTHRFNCRLIY